MRFLIFLCKFNSSFIQELTIEHNKQMTWLDLDYDTYDTCFLSWGYAFLSCFVFVCVLSKYSAYIVYKPLDFIYVITFFGAFSLVAHVYVWLSINCTQVYLHIYVWLATDPVSSEIHCLQAFLSCGVGIS